MREKPLTRPLMFQYMLTSSLFIAIYTAFGDVYQPPISESFIMDQYLSISIISLPFKISYFSAGMIAMKSWLTQFPNAELILLGPNDTYYVKDYLHDEYPDVRFILSTIELGEANKPLVTSWFQKGYELATGKYLMYINADIYLHRGFNKSFYHMVKTLQKNKSISSFMLGTDRISARKKKDFDENTTMSNIEEYLNFKGRWYISGCDVFIMPRKHLPFDFTTFPPFEVGLPRWDNFFMQKTIKNSLLINFKYFQPVYHIEHESQWAKRGMPLKQRRYVYNAHLLWKKSNGTDCVISDAQMAFNREGKFVVQEKFIPKYSVKPKKPIAPNKNISQKPSLIVPKKNFSQPIIDQKLNNTKV